MESKGPHIIFQDQIVRYLAEEMTDYEREQFERTVASDAEKLAQLSTFRKIWEGVDQLAARTRYDMDGEWNLMAEKIDFPVEEKQAPKTRSIRTLVLRIAAVLVIGLLGVAGWYGGKQMLMYDQVAVEMGTHVLTLPDGTLVTLNSGSTVKYTKNESLSTRKVKLSGEAFFEVSRDASRPFIIEAGPAQIEVLGTSFNVYAYPDSKEIEVTVSTGLVAMSSKHERGHQIILNKGNTGVYSKIKEELNLINEGKANAISWKTRRLEFSDTPLDEVVSVLNHTYQAEIILQDQGLSEHTITVSFNKQELDAVLHVLVNTLDLSLEKEGGKIIIGTK